MIPDRNLFDVTAAAMPAAQGGQLVTFGIHPDRAKTGYGYLELSQPTELGSDPALLLLCAFFEKPDAETAATMVADGATGRMRASSCSPRAPRWTSSRPMRQRW
jgi:mannose-1-phosphate guanylyltransferase/mannose-6-phosphate isomerase